MLFYLVTAGKVEVSIHASKFKVGVLGQFMVPKYNTYSIENVGTHPAQLYYVNVCPPEPAASSVHAQEQGAAAAATDSDDTDEE
ncbi:hypothetical protein GGI22_008006 [Coemansia erecta]|nr:hypothetical protein GGI22_008006 [Coemansia erecta]